MKLFFLKEHSLYKIFKTLEKVPKNKTVQIYIEPEHSFFDNEWRGKQIKEILEQKQINAEFVTRTEKARKFFTHLGLDVHHQEQKKFLKALNLLYLFFFNIKKFHLTVYNKKGYVFYAVFAFEIIFALGILYMLYTLILPSAKIQVYPAQHIENIIYNFRYYPATDNNYPEYSRQIAIPYYTGYFDYKYEMSISVSHLKHIQNPSQGKIRIVNTCDQEYSFRPNTRFTTDDGLMFQAKSWFDLPAGYPSGNVVGEAVVDVVAMEKDAEGVLMGARGNVPKDTRMYIKNFKRSFYLKEIYGEAIEGFVGGSLESEGVVTQSDIDTLSGKLVEYVQQQSKNIVGSNFDIEDGLLLSFDQTITPEIKTLHLDQQPGEKVASLEGDILARLHFVYIKKTDLISAINTYLNQRPSQKIKLLDIDSNSLTFFDNIKKEENVYIIPTKIGVIQGYDFEQDINHIIEDMKSHIINMPKNEARNHLLSYPEVSTVRVQIRPPWYNSIPKLKSRIHITQKSPKRN